MAKIKNIDGTKRNRKFEALCILSQESLKNKLHQSLIKVGGDENVICGNGFLYMKGDIPIILTAHMDTVHEKLPQEIIYKNGTISSPQGIGGDDRCGVYMILEILKEHKPHVLFFEDEETGGIGSNKFIKTELCKSLQGKINFCIELDRRGSKDAVFYQCGNEDFEDYILSNFFHMASGSFTDICHICPELDCAGVNFSCGYYNAHTKEEYVVLSEMETVITQVKKLISKPTKYYEWVEAKSKYGLDDWYDYYDYSYGYKKTSTSSDYYEYYVKYMTNNGEEVYITEALSEWEALGMFFEEHPTYCYNDIVDYGFTEWL